MSRAENAALIQRVLDALFPGVELPLAPADLFTLLVAVVLSAQTTDIMVNVDTPRLCARAATPEALARVPVAEVRALIREVGLAPAKARALVGLSRLLVQRHGGRVPRSFEELEALPGVGHKTASVVMSQAFGVPAFPVDTHIHRLASRWGLSSGRSVAATERDLMRAFPRERWNTLHLQIIWFGRRYCPALRHDLESCPICSFAASRARARREERGLARRRS
jgi:endonuclease-3